MKSPFFRCQINDSLICQQKLQEEGLRMVKASEQLPSSAHKFSQESNRMSYSVLNIANEYMQAINDREDLLQKCILFFKSAKSVRFIEYCILYSLRIYVM